ncbi:MAG: GNAT family N-acetyltransferase [Microscillaceae bacterium]|nr:GNAT family N-acetyltransferase [Microscillaceae bacterium]
MFGNDSSPFVSEKFKSLGHLTKYVAFMLGRLRVSQTAAGCDFLICCRQTGAYVGVLHLYDLSSKEDEAEPKACAVGFAVAAPYRQRGYAFEALSQLLQHLQQSLGRQVARAYTDAENIPAQKLLEKLSFQALNGADRHRRVFLRKLS